MADNTTPSANAPIATDEVAGVHIQRVKIGRGVDGSFRDSSDSYTTGTINAANANLATGTPTTNSHVTVQVPDAHATWTAFLNGVWSAGTILNFQASADNISWYAIQGLRAGAASTNEAVSDLFADAPGGTVPISFRGSAAGHRFIRVTCSTLTGSDSITVQLVTSEAPGSVVMGAALPTGNSRIGQVALTDGVKSTYSATLNSTDVASPTTSSSPIWEIQNPTGSGKIFRLMKLDFQITLATAAAVRLHFVRRANSTGGTAVAQARVSHDSTNPAASAVVNLYTAAPTAGSQTGGGVIRQYRIWGYATTLTATTSPLVFDHDWGIRPGQAVVLRPGEALSIQSPVAFGTAPTLTGKTEWTEETI